MRRIVLSVLAAIALSSGLAALAFAQQCGNCSNDCDFHRQRVAGILANLKVSAQNPAIKNGSMNYSTESSPFALSCQWRCAQKACGSTAVDDIERDIAEIQRIRRDLPSQPTVKMVDPRRPSQGPVRMSDPIRPSQAH